MDVAYHDFIFFPKTHCPITGSCMCSELQPSMKYMDNWSGQLFATFQDTQVPILEDFHKRSQHSKHSALILLVSISKYFYCFPLLNNKVKDIKL